jgi:mono/diheme cytochrome c family protein
MTQPEVALGVAAGGPAPLSVPTRRRPVWISAGRLRRNGSIVSVLLWAAVCPEQARLAAHLEGLRDTVRVPPDGAPPPGDPDRGRALYEESQCASCHRIGSEGENTGPELSNASRLEPSYIAVVLRSPQSLAPTSEMPDLGLTDEQIGDLIAYLGKQAVRIE